jgi:hypothetical protein
MKKILLFIGFLYIGTLIGFTQSLELTAPTGKVSNGDTIVYTSTDAHVSFAISMSVKNVSANDMDVRLKKVELDTVGGSSAYFCWDNCYDSTIFVSNGTVKIKAGQTNKHNFVGEFDSWGNVGKSYVMFVFYNDKSPNDSIAFVAKFNVGSAVGISKIDKKLVTAKVFPNPATNSITLNYALSANANNVYFELRNILGSVVRRVELTDISGQMKIDISDLKSGIYFYTVRVENRTVITEKLIVK